MPLIQTKQKVDEIDKNWMMTLRAREGKQTFKFLTASPSSQSFVKLI